jgi:hypothetical protein
LAPAKSAFRSYVRTRRLLCSFKSIRHSKLVEHAAKDLLLAANLSLLLSDELHASLRGPKIAYG